MSTTVMLLVLLAALLHASWNALVKSSPDKFLDIVVITGSAALFSAAVLPFLSLPRPASWSCVAASAVIHVAYFLLTGASYRTGDMSQAYPLMRGGPPLLVALASGPLIGQHLGAGEWAGIVLISGGLLALVFMERGAAALSGSAMRFALINVVVIASYLLIDGTGARLSGNPVAYTMWIFLLTAPAIVGWSLLRRRADLARHLGSRWHLGLTGGAFTLGAYVLVLWAMTHAPVAVVAALRESAILFGMADIGFRPQGTLRLEPHGSRRHHPRGNDNNQTCLGGYEYGRETLMLLNSLGLVRQVANSRIELF